MKNAKHTPGPWIASSRSAGDIDMPGYNYSATLVCNNDMPKDEIKANIRLCAAAPELLDALKEMRKQFAEVSEPHADFSFYDAAIAKAEGRA